LECVLAPSITSLDEALRIVIKLESSEINQIFQDVFETSDSLFVHKLLNFRRAITFHIAYIVIKLSELSQQLSQGAIDLNAKFPVET